MNLHRRLDRLTERTEQHAAAHPPPEPEPEPEDLETFARRWHLPLGMAVLLRSDAPLPRCSVFGVLRLICNAPPMHIRCTESDAAEIASAAEECELRLARLAEAWDGHSPANSPAQAFAVAALHGESPPDPPNDADTV
jgi:hypothetical protein